MDKEYTLTLIRDGLLAGGMEESTVKANMKKLKKLFDPMTDEEFEKRLSKFGGAEGIVTRLMRDYTEKKAAKEEKEAVIEEVAAEEAAGQDEEAEEKEGPDIYVSVSYGDEEEAPKSSDHGEVGYEDQFDPSEYMTGDKEAVSAEEYFGNDEVEEESPRVIRPPKRGKKAKHAKAKVQMTKRGKTTFTIGLILLLPFVIALVAAVTAIFAAIYGVMFVLTVLSCVFLVVGSAIGTALCLVAVIYGVIQLYQVFPIGLYEMGIGIIAGGATLFVSILLYNFVVRFVPFASRQLLRLYGFLWKQLIRLARFAKEACEKL